MPSFGREEIEMQFHHPIMPWVLCAVAASALLVAAFAAAQTQPGTPAPAEKARSNSVYG